MHEAPKQIWISKQVLTEPPHARVKFCLQRYFSVGAVGYISCQCPRLDCTMSGSHPIVTEQAKNIEIRNCYFDGSWNKGKGGNGYVCISRAWDCLIAGNVLRNLRHLTFQWSSARNVAINNDLDYEVNLHGGWERYNLVESNTIKVPYGHRPGNCTAGCGDGGAPRY